MKTRDIQTRTDTGSCGEKLDYTFGNSCFSHSNLRKNTKRYLKDVNVRKVSDRSRSLSVAVTKYIRKNNARSRYSRLKALDNRCLKDRIAMVLPGYGYLFSERHRNLVWPFFLKIRNSVAKEHPSLTKEANGFLVNYTKRRPFVSLITANEDYKVDESQYDTGLMELFGECFFAMTGAQLINSDPTEWGVKNKKQTSFGFPFETVNGEPMESKDTLWGIKKSNNVPISKAGMIMDQSEFKAEWRDNPAGCSALFEKVIEYIAVKGGADSIDERNVGSLVEQNMISVSNPSLRENNPDTGLNDSPIITLDTIIFGKDRFYSAPCTEDGNVWLDGRDPFEGLSYMSYGTIDKEKMNLEMRDRDVLGYKEPWYGFDQNQRAIYVCNQALHSHGIFLARGMLHATEHSAVGHPSNNERVLSLWRAVGDWMLSNGYEVTLTYGDCTNAEVTVTSNWKLFLNLVPKSIRQYLAMTAMTVTPMGEGFHVEEEAYASGVWYTTWFHVLKGNFENLRISLQKLERNGVKLSEAWKREVVKATCATLFYHERDRAEMLRSLPACLKEQEGIVTLDPDGNYLYAPSLGTDDIVSRVAWKSGHVPLALTKDDVEHYAKSMLNVGSTDRNNSFGMDQTINNLEEAAGNSLKATFTSERMGFYAKDVFSTWVRISMSPIRDIITRELATAFPTVFAGPESVLPAYEKEATKFAMWLSSTGVEGLNVESMFNEYSPKDQLLIGKLVAKVGVTAKELRNRSSAVSEETCNRVKNELIQAFFTNHNQFKPTA